MESHRYKRRLVNGFTTETHESVGLVRFCLGGDSWNDSSGFYKWVSRLKVQDDRNSRDFTSFKDNSTVRVIEVIGITILESFFLAHDFGSSTFKRLWFK